MRRFVMLLIVFCLSMSLVSCSGNASSADTDRVLAGFIGALKTYDREAMSRYLTEFPDISGETYTDDIFSDNSYAELYRSLYSDITYAVTGYEKNNVTIKIKMPDIAGLYEDTCSYVDLLAEKDPALKQKLKAGNTVFIQEMMRERAERDVKWMSTDYELTLIEKNDQVLIVCNDELRALMTGNFYCARKTVE